jgi:hypothetical protein
MSIATTLIEPRSTTRGTGHTIKYDQGSLFAALR